MNSSPIGERIAGQGWRKPTRVGSCGRRHDVGSYQGAGGVYEGDFAGDNRAGADRWAPEEN